MVTVHSFLQRFQQKAQGLLTKKNIKAGLVIACYALMSIILVLQSDYFHGSGSNKVLETFANVKIMTSNMESIGETKVLAAVNTSNLVYDPTQDMNQDSITSVEYNGGTGTLGTVTVMSQDVYTDDLETLTEDGKSNTLLAGNVVAVAANDAFDEAVQVASSKSAAKSIKLSSDEIEILERIVEAEATGEDIKGKILVGNVIINRVNDSSFPDSVEEVVFQKTGGTYQFSPISDKRYWSVDVTEETKEAVQRILEGEDYSEGALYFSCRAKASSSNMKWFDNNLKWLFQYGGHEFFTHK